MTQYSNNRNASRNGHRSGFSGGNRGGGYAPRGNHQDRVKRYAFNDIFSLEVYPSQLEGILANVTLVVKTPGSEHSIKGFSLRDGQNGLWLASAAKAKNGGGYFNYHYCNNQEEMSELAEFASACLSGTVLAEGETPKPKSKTARKVAPTPSEISEEQDDLPL